jgi:hypothetical protein
MAGFSIRTAGGWQAVRPQSREPIRCAGQVVYVPSAAELIEILELIGRPKDHERANLLRAFPSGV